MRRAKRAAYFFYPPASFLYMTCLLFFSSMHLLNEYAFELKVVLHVLYSCCKLLNTVRFYFSSHCFLFS